MKITTILTALGITLTLLLSSSCHPISKGFNSAAHKLGARVKQPYSVKKANIQSKAPKLAKLTPVIAPIDYVGSSLGWGLTKAGYGTFKFLDECGEIIVDDLNSPNSGIMTGLQSMNDQLAAQNNQYSNNTSYSYTPSSSYSSNNTSNSNTQSNKTSQKYTSSNSSNKKSKSTTSSKKYPNKQVVFVRAYKKNSKNINTDIGYEYKISDEISPHKLFVATRKAARARFNTSKLHSATTSSAKGFKSGVFTIVKCTRTSKDFGSKTTYAIGFGSNYTMSKSNAIKLLAINDWGFKRSKHNVQVVTNGSF